MNIQELLDKSLERKDAYKKSGKWSPSLFGSCLRRQYWNRADELPTSPIDALTLRRFAAGDLFHNFVQNILLTADTSLQKEVTIETEDVKGRADLITADEVIDIKSQHSRSFFWMAKTKDIKKDRFNNWMQVMWYARELGKPYGRLVFVEKDALCIQEYRLPCDAYWQGMLDEELAALRNFWGKKLLPPPEPRLYGVDKAGKAKECGFCVYSINGKCKEGGEKK